MPLRLTVSLPRFNVLFLLGLFAIAPRAFAWSTWIGVIQDWPIVTETPTGKQTTYESRVRPLFLRVDSTPWQAAPKPGAPATVTPLPKTVSWDVCFGGRQEGTITSVMPEKPADENSPPFMLRDTDHAPWRTRRSLDFASSNLEPVYKPIILSSSMNASCKDPEKWKQGNGEKHRNQIAHLIELIGKLPEAERPTELYQEKTTKPMRSWANKEKKSFVSIRSKIDKNSEMISTFAHNDSDYEFVGHFALMVDAGDFDSDGKTELIFKQRTKTGEKYLLFNGSEKIAEISF